MDNTTLRIAGIADDSVVDGPGVRFTVFTQGCLHRCEGCHNPETWDTNNGYKITVDEIMKMYMENPLLTGITFSGGEPFLQPLPLANLADKVHETGGNVWCYTGYTMEQLTGTRKTPRRLLLLSKLDALVDGKFILAQRDLTLRFRGSRNQRIWIKNKKSNEWEVCKEEEVA